MMKFSGKMILGSVLLLLLGACTTQPPIKTETASDRLVAVANQRQAAGDYEGAVDYYLRAAAIASDDERQAVLLQAAGNLMALGELERAQTVMNRITLPHLTASERQHYDILQAFLALDAGNTQRVLVLLSEPPADQALLADYYWLRGEALQRERRLVESIHARIAADPLITRSERQLANQAALWTALTTLPDDELQALRTAPPPDALSGWVELVELRRLYLQEPDRLLEVMPHWEARYPGHPASYAFAAKLAGGMRIAGQPPSRVALLLPMSGDLSEPAAAIRDGIVAAYLESPQEAPRPEIIVYDTGMSGAGVAGIYQQAVDEGAEFIIGPLRKNAVRQLAEQVALPVPVLALNSLDASVPANTALFQFGLSPEDEAREVARRAYQDGHYGAVALVPQGSWGERISQAFISEWEGLGGALLEISRYDAQQTDHADSIRTLLNLDSSKARHRQLTTLAGQNIEFEPRRRQDADFIFILATPRQARLIAPQLSFHHASRLPVYATSHVYTGRPNASLDEDLNNIRFCDMPWVLDEDAGYLQSVFRDYWPDTAGRYGRFHALGIDAWHVLPYVDQLQNSMMGAYQGATGSLTLADDGRLRRELDWAYFSQGVPNRLAPTAEEPPSPLAVAE